MIHLVARSTMSPFISFEDPHEPALCIHVPALPGLWPPEHFGRCWTGFRCTLGEQGMPGMLFAKPCNQAAPQVRPQGTMLHATLAPTQPLSVTTCILRMSSLAGHVHHPSCYFVASAACSLGLSFFVLNA